MNIVEKRKRHSKRSRRVRLRIVGLSSRPRLSVFRSNAHIYAQIIAANGSEVITCASTLDKEVKKQIKYSGNIEAATIVGKTLAKRAKKAGVSKVAFDRSGFKFHGRIKALAEAVRENGMEL